MTNSDGSHSPKLKLSLIHICLRNISTPVTTDFLSSPKPRISISSPTWKMCIRDSHDITRLDTSTDSYDTIFIQIFCSFFTYIRDIRSQLLDVYKRQRKRHVFEDMNPRLEIYFSPPALRVLFLLIAEL